MLRLRRLGSLLIELLINLHILMWNVDAAGLFRLLLVIAFRLNDGNLLRLAMPAKPKRHIQSATQHGKGNRHGRGAAHGENRSKPRELGTHGAS